MAYRSFPRVRVWLAAVLAVLAPAAAQGQSTLRAGTEFRVNEYTAGAQRLPSAVMASDGSFFLVWESQFQDGDSFGIFGRRLSAAGVPLGPEFQVNQATLSDQKQPSVIVDPYSSRYTVVWTGRDASGAGVFARQYTDAGPAGPEFQVNTFTSGEQFLPRVSAGPGGLAVVWQSDGQDGSGAGVYGRLFTPAGVPVSGEFLISVSTAGNQAAPVVAALDNGRYAAAWLSGASTNQVVYSRLFDAAGAPLGPERAVADWPGPSWVVRDHVSIAAAPFATFDVGWWEASYISGKFGIRPMDAGVGVRHHDVNGVPTTSEYAGGAGSSTTARWQGALGMTLTGRVLVAYSSAPGVLMCLAPPAYPPCPPPSPEDGSGSAVFVKPVGWSGAPARVLVNTFTAGDQSRPTVASDLRGNTLVAWQSQGQDGSDSGVYAQRFGGLFPAAVTVDPAGNGVLDPGIPEEVRPTWFNLNGAAQSFGGSLYAFVGPAGATYTIVDGSASYGTVPNGGAQSCTTDCYGVVVGVPPARPAVHMDSYAGESLSVDVHRPWTLHVGGSFSDVSAASPFYRFIETLLHNGVTSGCGGTAYCPAAATNREQMAVFVLVARHGPAYAPPACTTPLFADVPASSPYCRWIEELARRGVVGGCGGGNYCPAAAVTREQMSVFVLRTLDPALDPPACTTPMFADVPASSPYCRWIEELARRGIVGGCGGGNYCPAAAVTRDQMAVFLTGTFGLRLY